MAGETDWTKDFKITKADLERLIDWLKESGQPVTTEQITRRIIRGRLRYGADESQAALPSWVKEQLVLSWDEMEKWCVGCQVLVARTINDEVTPFFGVIQAISQKYYDIQIEGKVISYTRVLPGSEDAKKYYEYIKASIWKKEAQQNQAPGEDNLEKRIDIILLKDGAKIASEIISALNQDSRFSAWSNHWFLPAWLLSIDNSRLQYIYKELFRAKRNYSLREILELLPELPSNKVGEFSLSKVLSDHRDWFIEFDDGWRAKPPAWEQAVGAYYVYDPETYEIILKPGEGLIENLANRLYELGFYADVIQPKD